MLEKRIHCQCVQTLPPQDEQGPVNGATLLHCWPLGTSVFHSAAKPSEGATHMPLPPAPLRRHELPPDGKVYHVAVAAISPVTGSTLSAGREDDTLTARRVELGMAVASWSQTQQSSRTAEARAMDLKVVLLFTDACDGTPRFSVCD
jgi:hypothetical protein